MEPAGSGRLKGCHRVTKDTQISQTMKQTKSAGLRISQPRNHLNSLSSGLHVTSLESGGQFRVLILQHTRDLHALLNPGYRPL